MYIAIDKLKANAPIRPKGYIEDVIKHGTIDPSEPNRLNITLENYAAMVRKYSIAEPIAQMGDCCGKKTVVKKKAAPTGPYWFEPS